MRPSRPLLALITTALVATVLAGPVPVGATPAAARAAASTVDDRGLARSKGWTNAKSPQAYKKTLSRSTKKRASLTTRAAAGGGGSVTFQVGPGRGTVTIAVGKRTTKVSTAGRRVAFKTSSFAGTGKVRITVVKPGRGVYVDKVVLRRSGGSSATPAYATGRVAQVNTSASGAGSNGSSVNSASVSPDGKYLAFWSDATNLVPGISDGLLHLYVKNLSTNAVRAVDRSASGVLGNDGQNMNEARVVTWMPRSHELLFTTRATNLVDGTPLSSSFAPFLMAKDIDDNSFGYIAAGVNDAAWAPNATAIAFTSRYLNGCADGNACTGNASFTYQAFAWKVGTSSFTKVSANAAGVLPTDTTGPIDAEDPVWSPDSKRVAFMSWSKDLVPGDTNASRDVFVKTIAGGAITRVSTAKGGGQANNFSQKPVWSPDGTRIAFASAATNLVAGDNNAAQDVFVKNLASGAVTAVSTTAGGRFVVGVNGSDTPKWSPDGSKILFSSHAIGLVSSQVDKNSYNDVYVKTLKTGAVQLVSVLPNGTNASSESTLYGFDSSSSAAWAPDGRSVFFLSSGTNLSSRDNNAFQRDVFRKYLQ